MRAKEILKNSGDFGCGSDHSSEELEVDVPACRHVCQRSRIPRPASGIVPARVLNEVNGGNGIGHLFVVFVFHDEF
jgi:hypothetical protein